MSSLPLHPMIVHFPLVLAVLLPLAALVTLYLIYRNTVPVVATRLVALGFMALVGSGFLAMQTGEADEDKVEAVVAEVALETHEERAETLVWTAVAVLGIAIATTLVVRRRSLLIPLASLTAAGSIAVAVLALGVGHSGGELVYTHGAAAAHVSMTTATASELVSRPAAPDVRGPANPRDRHDRDDD